MIGPLYSFLFPVTDLTGTPLLSLDAKLGLPICDMDENTGSLLHFKCNREASGRWQRSRGDWILRQEVTCQSCVCMNVFGRDLRASVPLVIDGMNKATWGRFYYVLSERKYFFVASNIHPLWTRNIVVIKSIIHQPC